MVPVTPVLSRFYMLRPKVSACIPDRNWGGKKWGSSGSAQGTVNERIWSVSSESGSKLKLGEDSCLNGHQKMRCPWPGWSWLGLGLQQDCPWGLPHQKQQWNRKSQLFSVMCWVYGQIQQLLIKMYFKWQEAGDDEYQQAALSHIITYSLLTCSLWT